MTPTRPSPVVSFSEAEWQRFLTADRQRPNLLIVCVSEEMEAVVSRVMGLCKRPVHARKLPGELSLPEQMNGTLLLWDVAQLTRGQQMTLHDWITDRPRDAQVISITAAPLLPLVEDGQFLEGLFYRINVVSLVARVGPGRPDSQDDAPSPMKRQQAGGGRFSAESRDNQYPGRWPFIFH
jgi:transcriptional regulator of aromatic amino acid metabolism